MSSESESSQQQVAEQIEQAENPTEAPSVQSAPKKNKYLKQNFQYSKSYDDVNMIAKAFPALTSLQAPLDIANIENAHCYVIRSNNDDDVHKAIKYGIWTSVPGNNTKLNQAFLAAQELGVEVYLFFSVVKSGQFNSVARLKSSFQEETFSYWGQPHKFKGHFKVEWVFVKNVKQKQFEGLKNCQGDDISRSKDCTELNFDQTGRKMLQTFQEAPQNPSIFNFFQFFDLQEQEIRRHYKMLGNQNSQNNHKQRQSGHGANGGYTQNPFYNVLVSQSQNYLPSMNDQYQMAFYQNYQNMVFAQQMRQQASTTQHYTQDQLESLQKMCETHIYPPNTFNQQSYPKNQYNRRNNQSSQGNNRKQRNYKNEKPKQTSNEQQEVQQPIVEHEGKSNE